MNDPVPSTARAVVVTADPVALVKVTFCKEELPVTLRVPTTFKVPVTLEDAATKPPRSVNVVVVKAPRLVTI